MRTSKISMLILIFFGCLLVFIGAFFAYTSTFWYLAGSGRIVNFVEFLIGVIIIAIGSIDLILTLKKKTQRIFISAITLVLIASLSYNVYYVINLDDGYKPSPYCYCEIDSFNDSENMIKWIVKETYGTIEIEDIGLRLRNSVNGSLIDKATINYNDIDNSKSLTKEDTIEVYSLEDGLYIFEIIDWSTANLAFCSEDNY